VHILTKIFIVLVTLLAVAIVPLVATYTTNENSFRAMYNTADDQRRVSMTRATESEQSLVAQRGQMQQEIDARESTISAQRTEQANVRANVESLNAQIGRLEARLSQSSANLQALSSASEVNSELKQRFVNENYDLRKEAIDSERMVMEMEDQLEQSRYQSEEADRAKRKAIEERHNMEKQLDMLQARLDAYITKFGELEAFTIVDAGVAPDRTLSSVVLTVSRDFDDVLVEINVGSRDGVRKGWIMTVGSNGTFLGRLQIEQVDINRSVGRVTLEDASRGLVVPGSTVFAVKGRN
jgi:Asp-tRNA(Asn)/Glu-tRNA(Gln) amidotransferase A subunit family amidase